MINNQITGEMENFKNQLKPYIKMPSLAHEAILQYLYQATHGRVEIVDLSNPFTFSLDAMTAMFAALSDEYTEGLSLQYARNAQNYDQLYLHLSSRDYYGLFAYPAKTKVTFRIHKQIFIDNAIDDPIGGGKKMQIPQLTRFVIKDMHFLLAYPIDIRLLPFGAIQLTYSPVKKNPFHILSSNIIDYVDTNDGYMEFDVEMLQLAYNTYQHRISGSAEFRIEIPLQDRFCYAETFYQDRSGRWIEMDTIHQFKVVNIARPTAVLKVKEKSLEVHVPQVFVNNLNWDTLIRVDIYSSLGKIKQTTTELAASTPTGVLASVDREFANIYSDVFKQTIAATNMVIYTKENIEGGRNPLPFAEARRRTINNSTGIPETPISHAQMSATLIDQGYDITLHIDHATSRTFLASRDLPEPEDQRLMTKANATISPVSFRLEELAAHPHVIDNGDSFTITPEVLYKQTDGVVRMMPDIEKQAILQLPVEHLVLNVNTNKYLYTPLHYVIDVKNDRLDLRAYYLTDPKIQNLIFHGQNISTQMGVNVGSYGIEFKDSCYFVYVKTKSTDTFKGLANTTVHAQLSFVPTGFTKPAFVEGELVKVDSDGERYYRFKINTDFNIDSDGDIGVTNAYLGNKEPRVYKAPLQLDFSVIFATSAGKPANWEISPYDALMGTFLLPPNSYAIGVHKLRTKLGDDLSWLWRQARPTVTEEQYQRYLADIADVYEEDQHEVYPETGQIFRLVNGQIEFNIVHKKGDPKLNVDGTPIYKHQKGSVIVDEQTGKPILINKRKLLCTAHLLLVEGEYWFSTDPICQDYRIRIANYLVKWITRDLGDLNKRTLDNTSVYFSPKFTEGMIKVLYQDGLEKSIHAAQRFVVKLYVNASIYADRAMKEKLTSETISVVSSALDNKVVCVDDIQSALRKGYGQDVISVSMSGINGEDNFDLVTVLDDKARLSLRKKLVVQPNGQLTVEEDCTVEFYRHDQTKGKYSKME